MTADYTPAAVRAEILDLLRRQSNPLTTRAIRQSMPTHLTRLIRFYPGVVDNQLTTMAKNGLVARVRKDGKRTVYWTAGVP